MLLPRLACLSALLLPLAACPGSSEPSAPDATESPDAAPPPPDAAPRPDARILRGYGEECSAGADCTSGLCIGDDQSPWRCSRLCTLDVALDCKDVDAFCVPIGNGDNACWGEIETGGDLDDAVLEIGDSATRSATPLGDADLFLVRLNSLGQVLFQVTPQPSIDVQLEAYGVLGDPLGVASEAGPGQPEALQTDVEAIGGHLFMVVRNVGTATGSYTFSVTKQ